jgi:hypothetical protein
MKKIFTQKILFILLLTLGATLAVSETKAQCRYRFVNLANDTLSFSVPVDFPVKPNTGDEKKDEENFLSAFVQWNQSSTTLQGITLPTVATTGIKEVFFEISADLYASFSEEKKKALSFYPQLYRIKP